MNKKSLYPRGGGYIVPSCAPCTGARHEDTQSGLSLGLSVRRGGHSADAEREVSVRALAGDGMDKVRGILSDGRGQDVSSGGTARRQRDGDVDRRANANTQPLYGNGFISEPSRRIKRSSCMDGIRGKSCNRYYSHLFLGSCYSACWPFRTPQQPAALHRGIHLAAHGIGRSKARLCKSANQSTKSKNRRNLYDL